jgi:hypothetical protein
MEIALTRFWPLFRLFHITINQSSGLVQFFPSFRVCLDEQTSNTTEKSKKLTICSVLGAGDLKGLEFPFEK